MDVLRIFFNSSLLEIGTTQSLNQFKKIIKNEKYWKILEISKNILIAK